MILGLLTSADFRIISTPLLITNEKLETNLQTVFLSELFRKQPRHFGFQTATAPIHKRLLQPTNARKNSSDSAPGKFAQFGFRWFKPIAPIGCLNRRKQWKNCNHSIFDEISRSCRSWTKRIGSRSHLTGCRRKSPNVLQFVSKPRKGDPRAHNATENFYRCSFMFWRLHPWSSASVLEIAMHMSAPDIQTHKCTDTTTRSRFW